jgi:hypothetical protein
VSELCAVESSVADHGLLTALCPIHTVLSSVPLKTSCCTVLFEAPVLFTEPPSLRCVMALNVGLMGWRSTSPISTFYVWVVHDPICRSI